MGSRGDSTGCSREWDRGRDTAEAMTPLEAWATAVGVGDGAAPPGPAVPRQGAAIGAESIDGGVALGAPCSDDDSMAALRPSNPVVDGFLAEVLSP